MKKLLLILIISANIFLIGSTCNAQSLRVDSIIGFPDTVIDNQQVAMSILLSNSGGTVFVGDLAVLMKAQNDSTPDTLYYSPQDSIGGNFFYDTLNVTHTFRAADFDGGDNIVVVWPASSQVSVVHDSLTLHLYFNNVGIEENKMLQTVQLFPNPSAVFIKLRIAHPEKVEGVRVFDVLGNQLLVFSGAVSRFNIQSLSTGIYFVEVRNNDHSMIVEKFFRQ